MSFNQTIKLLCDHVLIEPFEVVSEYNMHTCVHAWAVHVLNAEREILMTRLVLICIDSAVSKNNVSEYWVKEQRLLSHVHKCFDSVHDVIDLESQDNWTALNTVHNLKLLYADQNKIVKAEAMYQWALKSYEKTWGLKHTSTLRMINYLKNLYVDQNKMIEAEVMY